MKERAMKVLYALGIVLVIYVGILAIAKLREYPYIGSQYPNGNTITVTGEGEVFAVPDIAEITFSINEGAATLSEAQEAATLKMNAAIEYLKSQGIDEKDIKTTNYSANPRYEYHDINVMPVYDMPMQTVGSAGSADAAVAVSYPVWNDGDTRVLVGYDVNQTISVKVRDTNKAGELIAGVTAKGITDVYGPNFTIDDEDDLQREARRDAINDARAKAEQLADDLDVRLVRVVSFSENNGGYYPLYAKAEEMAMDRGAGSAPAAPVLTPGENRISASVMVTYEIR